MREKYTLKDIFKRPTSWSSFSGLLTRSYTLPLLQLPAEVTGTHLLWGILGRLPEDMNMCGVKKKINKCVSSRIYPLQSEHTEGTGEAVQKVTHC